jgi:hypothetical protein
MAVAHSAASETTGAGATVTHTHTPGAGTVSGITVMISHGTVFTDIITGVTYGGVAMTRQTGANAFDNGGEIGRTYIYTLDASIPAGAQSVVVSKSNATTTIHVVAASVITDSGVAEVVTANANGGDDANEANPVVTLSLGGKTSMAYCIEYNGVNAPGSMTEFAGQTALHDHDFGQFSSKASRLTSTTAVDPSMGYTVAINAFALSAVAWAEVAGATITGSGSPVATLSPFASGTADHQLVFTGSGTAVATLSPFASGSAEHQKTYSGTGAAVATLSPFASGTGSVDNPTFSGSGTAVATLSPFSSGTAAVVNPTFSGSGTAVATLSAFASGTATMTPSDGPVFTGSGAVVATLSPFASGAATMQLEFDGSGSAVATLSAFASGTATMVPGDGEEEPEPRRKRGKRVRFVEIPEQKLPEHEDPIEIVPDAVELEVAVEPLPGIPERMHFTRRAPLIPRPRLDEDDEEALLEMLLAL